MAAERFTPYIKPVEIGADNESETAAWALSNFTLHLSLIHISEPTRPY